jgi:hypothetical protein
MVAEEVLPTTIYCEYKLRRGLRMAVLALLSVPVLRWYNTQRLAVLALLSVPVLRWYSTQRLAGACLVFVGILTV